MKKKALALLLAALLLAVVILPASAAESASSTRVIYYPDGSYLVITLHTGETRNGSSTSGSVSSNFYDAFNTLQWTATLYGDFTYDGTTATCTGGYLNTTVYNSAWHQAAASAHHGGNSITGSFTMEKVILGFTVSTVSDSLTLTCSPTGTLS